MKYKWHKTKFPGVRYREHPTRKHGINHDRYFAIRYQKDGVRKEEGLGWASGGWTEKKAFLELEKLRSASIIGKGETRLSEIRQKERLKKEEDSRKKDLDKRENILFSDFWKEYYLPYIEECKSNSNVKRQKSLYDLWVEPALGEYKLSEITSTSISPIQIQMKKGGRSPRSIEYALAVTRQIFNYAIKIDLYNKRNPVSLTEIGKYDNKRLRFLSKEIAKELLTELKKISQQTYEIALISLGCGLRAGEIFSLQYADIDLEHGYINVMNTKTKRNRSVPMPPTIKQLFQEKVVQSKKGLVFKDKNGNKIKTISHSFPRVVDALKLNEGITDRRQKVTFHTLRHTYASWLVMSGVDLYTVQSLLGHQSIEMTQRYSHLAPKHLESAIKVFSGTLEDF